MSRTRKLQNKRRARTVVVYDHDEKGKRAGRRKKGPARTTPVHGKRSRWLYDAAWRKKKSTPRAS